MSAVHYPGLPDDPWHARAARFMDGFGAMLSFELAATRADGVRGGVEVFTHAKSLGGVESLIDRRGPSLLRLSVGCEHVEDLWRDLDAALQISGWYSPKTSRSAPQTSPTRGVVLERLADRGQQVVACPRAAVLQLLRGAWS